MGSLADMPAMTENAPHADRRATATLGRLRDAALVLFALFAAALHFATFRDYVFEDAYITFRYADNLASGHGFAFNPGERVFGTSTPLYALLLAALRLLGLEVATAGGAVYALALSLTALGGAWILRRFSHPNLAAVYALIVLWGAGNSLKYFGMETTLYSCLLLATLIAALAGRPVLTGLFLGLAFLTRYDAFMLTAALFPALWIANRCLPWRTYLTAGAVVAPWLVFSYLYFGTVLPNTLAAKTQKVPTSEYMRDSLARLGEGFFSPAGRFAFAHPLPDLVVVLVLVALAAPLLWQTLRLVRRQALLAVLLAFPVLLWLGYSLIGPPLSHSWYLVPGMFSFVLFCFLAWGRSAARWSSGIWPAALTLLLVAASSLALPAGVRSEKERRTQLMTYRQRVDSYEHLARWITDRSLNDLTLLAFEPGYLAYRTKMRVIDGTGLVTRGMPREGSNSVRLRKIAADRRPDLIIAVERAGAKVRGYVPLHHTVTRTLYIEQEVLQGRIADLSRRRLEPVAGGAAEAPGALAHPFFLEFEDLSPGWVTTARWQGAVGHPEDLYYRGEKVRDQYLHTHGARDNNTVASPPLHLDFDLLSFRFSAPERERTAVQLLVDGLAVLAAAGGQAAANEMTDVVWPVHAWRGRTAVLRLVDESPHGFVALDRLRSSRYERQLVVDDFESGSYGEHWAATFGERPCPYGYLAGRFGLHTVLGRATAASLCARGGQRLVSRPLRIAHERLAFVVLDFGNRKTRVELRAGSEVVRRFYGGRSQMPVGVVWDVSPLRGRRAVLAVIDEDPRLRRGIGIDDVVFFDPEDGP